MSIRRQEEFDRETGRFKRGLVQTGRFIIFGGAAYWIASRLLANEVITHSQIYRAGIPRSVPEMVLTIGIALGILIGFELIYFLVYVWLKPGGRRRGSTPYVSREDLDGYEDW